MIIISLSLLKKLIRKFYGTNVNFIKIYIKQILNDIFNLMSHKNHNDNSNIISLLNDAFN